MRSVWRALLLFAVVSGALCADVWAVEDIEVVSAGAPKAIIVVNAPRLQGVAGRAVEILIARIEERSGAKLEVRVEAEGSPASAFIVLGVRPDAPGEAAEADAAATRLKAEGFALCALRKDGKPLIQVVGADERGLLFGVGALLRHLDFKGKNVTCPPVEKPVTAQPWMTERAIYYASHMKNFYEAGKTKDITRDIEDAALWGINAMWVWMLPVEHYNDISDPLQKEEKGLRHWKRVTGMMKTAKSLGMRTGAVFCANTVFLNQVTPEIRATGGHAINKKALVCPSVPEGRRVILKTRETLFRLAKEARVQIDGVTSFAVDSGGCECDKCLPWLHTYLKLTEESTVIARKYYPGVRFYLCNWWWRSKFCRGGDIMSKLNARPRDWFAGIASVGGSPVKLKFGETYAWMNYASQFYYGLLGCNPMPERLTRDFRKLKESGIVKVQEYCEGRYQSLNNALYAQLGWNAQVDPKAVFARYAHYHFGVSDEAAKAFADAVLLIEKETPWLNQYRFTPETSKAIYDACRRCEKERADWPGERYYWDVFLLRAKMGHTAHVMGTPDELRKLKAHPNPARLAQIKTAFEELQAATNPFFKKYGYHTTAPLGVPRRYEIVWKKQHKFHDWHEAYKAAAP